MFAPTVKNSKLWYGLYCYANAALYLIVVAILLLGIKERTQIGFTYFPNIEDPGGLVGQVCALFALMFGMFAIVCVGLPFQKRNKTWYTVHFVNLVLGATSCIFTPICIYLMMLFLRPEIRAYWEGNAPEPQ